MYGILDYCTMVARDEIRKESYLRALRTVVTKESVVVDLGAGIGLFALAAAKMGARHVYAVDDNPCIELGRELAKAAGVGDRVTFLNASAWDVHLPDTASVLFYDLRGTLPLFQDNFALVAHAKRSWLSPDGVHFPRRDVLHAAVVHAPGCYAKLDTAAAAVRALGLPDESVKRCLTNMRMNDRDTPIAADGVLTESMAWATLEYGAPPPKSVSGQSDLTVTRPGLAHGIGVWFATELLPGIEYDTSPGREPTYSRAFLPFSEPFPLTIGDRVSVELRAMIDGVQWGWSVGVTRADGTTMRRAKQTTMLAELRPMDALLRDAPSAMPSRSEQGERALRVLAAMDGKTSNQTLRDMIGAADESGTSSGRAIAEVASLVSRYGR